MGGLVCAVHRRKNKGFPTLKRTLNLGIEKGRLLKNSRPKGGLIQVICYPASPETVDITGFFEKFCIAIRTTQRVLQSVENQHFEGLFVFPYRKYKWYSNTLKYNSPLGRVLGQIHPKSCAKVFACGVNDCAAQKRCRPGGRWGDSPATVLSIPNIHFNRPSQKEILQPQRLQDFFYAFWCLA